MCGIAGLYTLEPRPDRAALHHVVSDMTAALRARGPDYGDVWQDPDAPLALGHRRLSILDRSAAGHQPMSSASGRYMVAYNGEIYNFKEIKAALPEQKWSGQSDTEVLLAAIEAWGIPKTLEKINGMFAFAVWDRKSRALYLARDHMGKKPLYVGWSGSSLVFASELKALHAHPDFRPDVNRASLTSYMRFGYVPAPMCIYDQVWQIPAGCMMAVDMDLLRGGQDLKALIAPYWTHKQALEAARKNPATGDVVKDFESLLSDSTAQRMVSDVPLGAFLSGGIDSSTIVALMQKQSSERVKTYTIGFSEQGYSEADHAAKIAAHLGTDHHEMILTAGDALDVVPILSDIYDEPFADASAIPTYLLSRFARKDVSVALSGDGGDEMLGGYNRHIQAPKVWNFINNSPANVRQGFAEMMKTISPARWDKFSRRNGFGVHMHKLADVLTKQSAADVYLGLVSTWQYPKRFMLDGREEMIPLVDPAMQIEDLSFAEEMMYWDTLSYLGGGILTKVDRATMAVGLEARSPLLDKRIYDYVWRLPLEMKIKDKKGKYLLREVLKRHVPEELFNRPKAGFTPPIAAWLRGDLKDWAEDLLDISELKAQGLLNYHEIEKMWQEHQKGRGNHAQKLWTVLMFQQWHRRWISK